jgi:antibiotic biosynthesis monooxygenase (ABM) superfamily enzyme
MNRENTDNTSKTVTSVISRSIRPGYEKDYDDWVQRYLALERKAAGYLGTTIILPGGNRSNVRYIIRRFTDKASMQVWDNSQESQKLLEEANSDSTRHYETTTGLETWFEVPDMKPGVAPPRWKMAIVVFIAAYVISVLTRSFLTPSIGHWPILANGFIFTAILTIGLTYFAIPILNRLLRRWLYPRSRQL